MHGLLPQVAPPSYAIRAAVAHAKRCMGTVSIS